MVTYEPRHDIIVIRMTYQDAVKSTTTSLVLLCSNRDLNSSMLSTYLTIVRSCNWKKGSECVCCVALRFYGLTVNGVDCILHTVSRGIQKWLVQDSISRAISPIASIDFPCMNVTFRSGVLLCYEGYHCKDRVRNTKLFLVCYIMVLL